MDGWIGAEGDDGNLGGDTAGDEAHGDLRHQPQGGAIGAYAYGDALLIRLETRLREVSEEELYGGGGGGGRVGSRLRLLIGSSLSCFCDHSEAGGANR